MTLQQIGKLVRLLDPNFCLEVETTVAWLLIHDSALVMAFSKN